MKPIPFFSASTRALPSVLLAATALFFVGCFGRQAALKLTDKMTAGSEAVLKTTEALKQAEEKTVTAFSDNLKAHVALSTKYKEHVRALALAELNAAFQEQNAAMEALRAETMDRIARHRASLLAVGFADLKTALKPLEKKVEAAFAAVEKAAAESTRFAGDSALREARVKADANYLGAAAVYNQLESDSSQAMAARLDELFIADLDTLATKVVEIRKQLKEKLDAAKERFGVTRWPEMKFGEGLKSNAAAYQMVSAYVDSVKTGSEGIDLYLKMNSFGKGSFIEVFATAVIKGFPSAVHNVIEGKFTNWSEVATDFNKVADQTVADVKTNFDTESKGLVDSLKTETKGLGTTMGNLLKGKVDELAKNATIKFSQETKLPSAP